MAPPYFSCLLAEYTTCIPTTLGYLLFCRPPLHCPNTKLLACWSALWNNPGLQWPFKAWLHWPCSVKSSRALPSRSHLWFLPFSFALRDWCAWLLPLVRFVTLSRQAPCRLHLWVPSVALWSVLRALSLSRQLQNGKWWPCGQIRFNIMCNWILLPAPEFISFL